MKATHTEYDYKHNKVEIELDDSGFLWVLENGAIIDGWSPFELHKMAILEKSEREKREKQREEVRM